MPILALLKLLPARDWGYIAAIAALLIAFGWYTHHERAVQHAKDVAANAKAVATQIANNAKVEADANKQITAAVGAYKASVSAPPVVHAPRLVCHAAASGSAVQSHAGAAAGSDGGASVPAESTVPFDPAPGVLGDARDADAQVVLLQRYVRICQEKGICAK